ncbi:hypothetical protein R3P38DRAFT_2791177 [Favolaschia claudopus]|uniref:Uncharacterized protein n=1 Tax=Favolaschia claudopus TaxID=2862362 RepID=A0AAW0AGA5_9AGAR
MARKRRPGVAACCSVEERLEGAAVPVGEFEEMEEVANTYFRKIGQYHFLPRLLAPARTDVRCGHELEGLVAACAFGQRLLARSFEEFVAAYVHQARQVLRNLFLHWHNWFPNTRSLHREIQLHKSSLQIDSKKCEDASARWRALTITLSRTHLHFCPRRILRSVDYAIQVSERIGATDRFDHVVGDNIVEGRNTGAACALGQRPARSSWLHRLHERLAACVLGLRLLALDNLKNCINLAVGFDSASAQCRVDDVGVIGVGLVDEGGGIDWETLRMERRECRTGATNEQDVRHLKGKGADEKAKGYERTIRNRLSRPADAKPPSISTLDGPSIAGAPSDARGLYVAFVVKPETHLLYRQLTHPDSAVEHKRGEVLGRRKIRAPAELHWGAVEIAESPENDEVCGTIGRNPNGPIPSETQFAPNFHVVLLGFLLTRHFPSFDNPMSISKPIYILGFLSIQSSSHQIVAHWHYLPKTSREPQNCFELSSPPPNQ